MVDTKLIQFLRLLSKAELKRFGLFVRSPYHNNLQNVSKLHDTLKPFYPKYDSKKLTGENVYGVIFPNTSYDESKLRSLCSYLLALAKKFLTVEYADKFDGKLDLAWQMRSRDTDDFFAKTVAESGTLLSEMTIRNANYYFRMFRFLFLQNELISHFSHKRNYQKEADSLTVFYLASVLRTFSTVYNRKSSLVLDFRSELADKIAGLANTKPYSKIPVVRLNYCLYMVARFTDSEEYFFEFLKLAGKHTGALTKAEFYEAHSLLLNFCVIKIQTGVRKFVNVKFELYKKMLSMDLFSMEKYFPYAFFNNIVSSALENDDTAFARQFIDEYSSSLEPKFKADLVNLSMARIHFKLGEYDDAISYLALTANNEDVFYKLAVRDFYIKIYFEKGEYEYILPLFDSYRHFVTGNKLLSGDTKKRYSVYLKACSDLVKLGMNPDKEKAEILIQTLNTKPGFTNKEWILEKIKGIINSAKKKA